MARPRRRERECKRADDVASTLARAAGTHRRRIWSDQRPAGVEAGVDLSIRWTVAVRVRRAFTYRDADRRRLARRLRGLKIVATQRVSKRLDRAAKRVDDEETISDLGADALSFDLRSMPDSLGSRGMGRGSRPVRRWRHDRKRRRPPATSASLRPSLAPVGPAETLPRSGVLFVRDPQARRAAHRLCPRAFVLSAGGPALVVADEPKCVRARAATTRSSSPTVTRPPPTLGLCSELHLRR